MCQVDAPLSRRSVASVLVAGLALLDARPASAFLGFGEASKEDVYKEETVRLSARVRLAPGASAVWSGADGRLGAGAQSTVLKAVGSAISLGKDDPGKEESVNTVRKQTNAWVAKYRRDSTFAGRPSYGRAPQPPERHKHCAVPARRVDGPCSRAGPLPVN